MRSSLAIAVVAMLGSAHAADQPDTRVHTILDAEGHPAMRFLYPEPNGPFNFVWTPQSGGWRSLDEAKLPKFAVVYCKDEVARKVPEKCGPFGGMFGDSGSYQQGGFMGEYASNFVGPPQVEFIGPPVPTNNSWQGTINGPGGPVPGGLPAYVDPFADRQACINTCYAAWAAAGLSCAVITRTFTNAMRCFSVTGGGATGCPGNC